MPSHEERSPDSEIIDPPTSTPNRFSKGLIVGVLISLDLHTVMMLIPTSYEPKAPAKEPEKQVRITQLPTATKVAATKGARLPKRVVKPNSSRLVIRSPHAPTSQAAATTSGSADMGASWAAASGSAATSGSGSPATSTWDDFPLYPNSQPGCFNLPSCFQTGDSLSQVSTFFTQELPARKYQIKSTLKESGREVFQVSRNGQAQFLSVIRGDKGSVYVLSDAPRSLADLKNAVEVPPEVSAILSNLDARNANPSYFAQPELFYTKSAAAKGVGTGVRVSRSGIRNISLVSGPAKTMMDEFFRTNLLNSDYKVTDLPQQYGGGKLYQVKKGSLTLYFNLVPTKDNSGTLVVTWKDPPS